MIPLFDTSALDIKGDGGVWKNPGDWFMTAYERNVLVALARSINAGVVIETGVQEGFAAQAMLRDVPSIHAYIGIDLLPDSTTAMQQQALEVPKEAGRVVKHDKRFALMLRKFGSHEILPEFIPKCDMFLIDGDHSRAGVEHDTMLARSRVKKGGLIVWHDYNAECVVDTKKCIDEMVENGHDIRRIDNTWLAVERVE